MESKSRGKKRSSKKEVGTMNVILVIVGVTLILFTLAMIFVFSRYGAIPDTLVTCVFAVCGGECGVMGWIKTTKERYRDRQYELEDREHEEKKLEDGSIG